MVNKLSSTDWFEGFLEPTQHFFKIMEKHTQILNLVLSFPVKEFSYSRCLKNNLLFVLSNQIASLKTLLKNGNSKANPFLTPYQNAVPGYHITWHDSQENKTENDITFCITEKNAAYTHSFYLNCTLPNIGQDDFYNKKTTLLKSFLDNRLVVQACFDQLKLDLYDLLENKKITYINLETIKALPIPEHKQASNTEKLNTLLTLKRLNDADLQLKEILLSPQEEYCLLLYTQGVQEQEIAKRIKQPLDTIKSHLKSLREKMQVTANPELFMKKEKLDLLQYTVH